MLFEPMLDTFNNPTATGAFQIVHNTALKNPTAVIWAIASWGLIPEVVPNYSLIMKLYQLCRQWLSEISENQSYSFKSLKRDQESYLAGKLNKEHLETTAGKMNTCMGWNHLLMKLPRPHNTCYEILKETQ